MTSPAITVAPHITIPAAARLMTTRHIRRPWSLTSSSGSEIAGIDPDKELEVWAGSGYLTIRAVRQGKIEEKHRTEFRYGSFSRTVQLPPDADTDDVATECSHGILTIKLGLKGQQQGAMRRVQIKNLSLTVPAVSHPENRLPCSGLPSSETRALQRVPRSVRTSLPAGRRSSGSSTSAATGSAPPCPSEAC